MGTFSTTCRIENHLDRTRATEVTLMVDSGSECTWVPKRTLQKLGIRREKKNIAFVMANGRGITRNVGFAVVRYGERLTIDEIVFAEDGDLLLLGARTLEGLNVTVDAARKKLLAAGPLPVGGPQRVRQ